MLTDLWPGLDFRHLAAFEAVARLRSFARAAQELGYTQPAVSQQVAALERIVGQRLVERSSGRAEAGLTEAGARLLEHVDDLSARLAGARLDLDRFARGDTGTVSVGSFQSASARILPRILPRFRELHPAVDIELVESTTDLAALDDVETGALDFSFCLLPVDDECYESATLVEDHYVLVTQEPVDVRTVADITRLPLIFYRTCRSSLALSAYLEDAGHEPNIVFRSDDNAAMKEMVRAGMGAAVLPELWLGLGGNDGLELTPLRDLVPPRFIGVAWRRDRELSPAQQAFLDVTLECYPAVTPASSGITSSPYA
jgi:DNA-binding transcriptional LysR family regulator